jgi:hypothetical protein
MHRKLFCELLCWFAGIACFAIDARLLAQAKMNTMPSSERAGNLSMDIVSFVPRPGLAIFAAEVRDVSWQRQNRDGIQYEIGPVSLRVVDVIHGSVAAGVEIEIGATRAADPRFRARGRSNQWDHLPLTAGSKVILAASPTSNARVWTGVAGAQFSPDNVTALKRASHIEYFRGQAQQRYQMIEEALESDNSLLQAYALDFVVRHAPGERDLGIVALRRAVADPRTSEENKLMLAFNMADARLFLQGSADQENLSIISTLAAGLVEEHDQQRQGTWATLLANAVLGPHSDNAEENGRIEFSLVHGPGNPPAREVLRALNAAASRVTGADRSRLLQVERIWQSGS